LLVVMPNHQVFNKNGVYTPNPILVEALHKKVPLSDKNPFAIKARDL
jgi:hypothetical protein